MGEGRRARGLPLSLLPLPAPPLLLLLFLHLSMSVGAHSARRIRARHAAWVIHTHTHMHTHTHSCAPKHQGSDAHACVHVDVRAAGDLSAREKQPFPDTVLRPTFCPDEAKGLGLLDHAEYCHRLASAQQTASQAGRWASGRGSEGGNNGAVTSRGSGTAREMHTAAVPQGPQHKVRVPATTLTLEVSECFAEHCVPRKRKLC